MNDPKTVARLLADAVGNLRENENKAETKAKQQQKYEAWQAQQLDEIVEELRNITKVLVEATFPGAWRDGDFTSRPVHALSGPHAKRKLVLNGSCALPGIPLKWGSDDQVMLHVYNHGDGRVYQVFIPEIGGKWHTAHTREQVFSLYIKHLTKLLKNTQDEIGRYRVVGRE